MVNCIKPIIFILLELVSCNIFIGAFLRPREYSRRKYAAIWILIVAAYAGAACIPLSVLRLIVTFVVIVFGMQILYNGSWKQLLLYSALEYGIAILTDVCMLPVAHYFISMNDSGSALQGIAKALLFMIVLVIRYLFAGMQEDNAWKPGWRFIIFPAVTGVIMLLMVIWNGEKGLMISAFGFLIANVLFYYILQDILKQERKIRSMEIQEIQTRNQIELYQTMGSDICEQQKRVHDFRKNLLYIQQLLEDGQAAEAEKCVKQFYGECRSTQKTRYTNHPIVNSILRQKHHQAEEKGITMIMDIGDLSELIVEDVDLVTVFTNLLDNAIEACERLDRKEKRIYFCCLIEGREFRVSVENPVEQEPAQGKRSFLTWKQNQREHGIGMENIHRIVEKYQGEDLVVCEKGRFLHTVILQMK